jgi:beta-lactamase class A
MGRRRGLAVAIGAALLGAGLTAFPAGQADAVSTGAEAGQAAASSVVCSSSSHPALAAKIGRDIQAARRGRVSTVAIAVDDPSLGLGCWLDRFSSFDSASVIKVTILAALLRKAEDQHRQLTATEAARAKLMITRSDNDAASALWAELGRRYLQHFLDVAAMRHTSLGPGSAWGLTQITANDQVVLLRLLLDRNKVLNPASRTYALKLMAEVIPAQRWGVPAGVPSGLTVHVKNGWLPLPTHGWRIHSIGLFTGHGGNYSIVVLTQDNPTMTYGITTIQAIARAINHDLRS